MAPDVTFAWFIRHFTLLDELLLNTSQISSCLLSSNCLWLTFFKSRMTRKMKNVVTTTRKDGRIIWDLRLSSGHTSTSIQHPQSVTTYDKRLWRDKKTVQMIPAPQEKIQTCLLVGEKVQWNYINIFIASLFAAAGGGGSRFIWSECRTSIYPAITRRQLGIIRR